MTLVRKPVSIVVIGLYYLVSPVLNLVQMSLATGVGLAGPVNLWTILSPLDWVLLAAFPIVGWGVLSVERWGWFAFMGFSLVLVVYNTVAFVVNRSYDLGLVLLFNATVAAVTFLFLRKHLRAPYFNPRLRWWKADPRYHVDLNATIPLEASTCEAEVLDISRSGLFLSTCADIDVGQRYLVAVQVDGRSFVWPGRVMRKTAPGDPRPGFGVMFEGLDKGQRREVSGLVRQLVKGGARERGLPEGAPGPLAPWWSHLTWLGARLVHEIVGR